MPRLADIVRRAFGSSDRPPQPVRPGRALALIDLHPHTRGGHFGAWLRWFATEFAARFDDVHVVTPDPGGTRSLFDGPASPPANLAFHRLPTRLRKEFDLGSLRKLGGVDREQLSAFVMWGYDLVELRGARAPSPIPWAALAGISWLRRGHQTAGAKLEAKLLEVLLSSPSCRAFVQPDEYVADGVEKAICIPDVEDVALPPQPGARAQRIRAHGAGRFCVGAFGVLTGPRCVNELLRLATAHPGVRFVLAGAVREETVDPEVRSLLAPGALENLLVLPGFIPTESELNDAIAATDAVFIDGRNYPVQSGIVCKAVHVGRSVLTPVSNSWTFDCVRRWGVGMAYASRDEDIAAAWTRWSSDGGEARSRAASAAMRDPRRVAACFDRVTNQLAAAWERAST